MGWFTKKTEKRAVDAEEGGCDDPVLRALLSQKKITREEALNLPSFAGCVEFIANAVAMLPVKLYAEGDGGVKEVLDDRRTFLLNDETGDILDGFQLKKAIVKDYLLDGKGYMYINRHSNEVESLHYVDCQQVSVNSGADPIFKRCDILVNGSTYRDFEFVKLLRNTKDGATGNGIVADNQLALSVAYQTLIFEEKLVKAGGCRKGFLLSEKKLGDIAMDALKAAWKKLFSNSEENVIILNDGLKFQEAGNSSVEMQLNENKKTNSAELCKLFPLSQQLMEGEATGEEHVTSVKLAVMPVLAAFEAALNKDLLLESEKRKKYFAFDTKEMLKGDIVKRFEAYKTAVDGNFMQIDEIRFQEDLPKLGLDFIKLGLSDVLYFPKTKEIYTPNTDMVMNLTKLKGGDKQDEN